MLVMAISFALAGTAQDIYSLTARSHSRADTMNSIPPNTGPTPQEMIAAFLETAGRSEAVRVIEVDGQSFQVQAEGRLDGRTGSRSVAWVREDTDTTSMFVHALAQRFGTGVSSHIAQALDLAPTPGKPLAARLVMQAVAMAETSTQALAGVDFPTQLAHSAQSNGSAFRAAAERLGIGPDLLDADARRAIDQQMQADFGAALARGESPVPPATATEWLMAHLRQRLNPTPFTD